MLKKINLFKIEEIDTKTITIFLLPLFKTG